MRRAELKAIEGESWQRWNQGVLLVALSAMAFGFLVGCRFRLSVEVNPKDHVIVAKDMVPVVETIDGITRTTGRSRYMFLVESLDGDRCWEMVSFGEYVSHEIGDEFKPGE